VQSRFNSHFSHRKHTGKSLANWQKPHYLVLLERFHPRYCVFALQARQ
jgi:hypothetical protein